MPSPAVEGRSLSQPLPHRQRRTPLQRRAFQSAVQIFGPAGELVWEAVEDDGAQRHLAMPNEVLWNGLNHANIPVGNGVYIYTIHSPEGTLLMRDKIAVVR